MEHTFQILEDIAQIVVSDPVAYPIFSIHEIQGLI